MFNVVVSILKLAEDGFHKLSESYGIYVAGSVFNVGEDFLLLMVDHGRFTILICLMLLSFQS